LDDTREPSPKIKVVDRRKFTADGDPREGEVSPTGASADQPTGASDSRETARPAAAAPPDEASPSSGASAESSQHFIGLVAMLAQQAELLLVGAEGMPARPEEARTVIDFLGVLETKTAGNLTGEESRVLSSVVYQLRSLFLQKQT
jgi:hypothetical protein